jgi:hypothetical protein
VLATAAQAIFQYSNEIPPRATRLPVLNIVVEGHYVGFVDDLRVSQKTKSKMNVTARGHSREKPEAKDSKLP